MNPNKQVIGLSYSACLTHVTEKMTIWDIGIIAPEQVVAIFSNTNTDPKNLSDPEWIKRYYLKRSDKFYEFATTLTGEGRILQPRLAITEIETSERKTEIDRLEAKIRELVSPNSYRNFDGWWVNWRIGTPETVIEQYWALSKELNEHLTVLRRADEYRMSNQTSAEKVWWRIERLLWLREENPELYSIWQRTVAHQATGKTREILAPYFDLPTEAVK